GVVADHAAEVGPAGGGDIGTELQAVDRECAVQLVEHQAGLHAGGEPLRIDAEELVEILAAVDDDAGADGLARETGAAAARRDRHVHFKGDLDGGMEILKSTRNDDAERLDLVDAGVGAVELTTGAVEADLALEMAVQMLGERLPLVLGEVG